MRESVAARVEQVTLIEGLRIERVLGRGAHSVVWSATVTTARMPWPTTTRVVVKLSVDSSSEHGGVLRREARFLARLRHPAVVRGWLRGTTSDGREYLVLSCAGEGSLDELVPRGPLPVERALAITHALASALHEAHSRGIVHRDLKPSNVLLDDGPSCAWLSDFGLAEDMPLAAIGLSSARVAGSFQYAAPEQSGMLRREVDGRSDLYALGGILFECLTGRPAFQADEVTALLTLHATVRPPDVRQLRADVPENVAQLVAKLLAKDPDDRYQTAQSLLEDLDRIARGESGFALATGHPYPDPFDSPPLVGRERVLGELVERAAQLRSGMGAAVWITGDQGMGKGRLCRTSVASIKGARVLWARCSLGHETSVDTFRTLLFALMRMASPEELEGLRKREGPALARLVPEVPGLPAPAQDLSGDAPLEAMARSFASLATREQPLVMVFEDADRLSAQELGLLRRVGGYVRSHPLLILCTGVTSKVTHEDSLWTALTLAPLSREHVETLLRYSLGPCPFDRRLVDLAHQCSAGNPTEVWVRACIALTEGVLDTDGSAWSFDEARFVSLPTPDTMGAPLAAILAKLSETERDVLSSAALLGQRFDARWLSSMGHVEADIDRALWAGIQLRLLASSDDRQLSFVRVDAVDLLCESLSDDVKQARYATLARSLALSPSATRAERALLARACFLTADAATAAYAYDLCLDAGLQALDAFAFSEALCLLHDALALTERYGLPADFRLHRGFAQLEAQSGAVEQAVASFVVAIESCPDAHERAAMHLRCAELRFFHDSIASRMREHLEQGWRELGREMPQSSPWSWLIGLWFALVAIFVERSGIKAGVDGTDVCARTRVRLCELTALYYFFTDQLRATFGCAMYGFYLGRRLGPCRELAAGLASIGNFCYIAGLTRWAERLYAETYALVEQLQDRAAFANTRYLQGVGLSFGGDLRRGELILAQTLDQYAGDLDVAYLATGAANLTGSYMARGYVQQAVHVYARLREHLRARLGSDAPLPQMCVSSQIDVLAQTNQLSACEQPVERLSCRLTSPEHDPLMWTISWHVLASWEHARGSDDSIVVAALDQSSRTGLRPEGATWLTARGWVAAAYMEFSLYRGARGELKEAHKHRLFLAIERARRAASSPYLRGHAHVLCAIRYWLQGKGERAERELVKAEREARLRDLPSVLVEARALRASMLLEAGDDRAAHHEGRSAMAVALACGQQRRVLQLEKELSISIAPDASKVRSSVQSSHGFGSEHTAERERDVLLQVAAVASGEIDPTAQARAILDRLLGLFGAERGMIFADGPNGKLERLAGRTAQQTDLDSDVVFAQTLVRRVRDSGTALVVTGTEEGTALGSQSVLAASLRSIVCTPIRLGDQTRGVLYLDSSLAKGVFTRDDLDILGAVGGYIALTQEMARAARVEIERRALDTDLQLSGALQSLLLPQQADLQVGELELSAAYAPASHSGGDWWAWEELEDGRLWLLVGDAAGHGAAAAMVTALLAGAHRNAIDSGVRDLVELLHALNRTVAALCRGRHTVTLLALEWGNTHELKVLSAAAPPLLKRHADGRIESVVVRGSGLGASPFTLGEATLALEPGARIVVVSDGILEMRMEDGRELGIRRLRKLFEDHGSARASALRDALMHEIDAIRGDAVVEDDLTLVVVSRD